MSCKLSGHERHDEVNREYVEIGLHIWNIKKISSSFCPDTLFTREIKFFLL